jgi:hypothetical protein
MSGRCGIEVAVQVAVGTAGRIRRVGAAEQLAAKRTEDLSAA